jgi:hypothetical protein
MPRVSEMQSNFRIVAVCGILARDSTRFSQARNEAHGPRPVGFVAFDADDCSGVGA